MNKLPRSAAAIASRAEITTIGVADPEYALLKVIVTGPAA